MSNVLLLTSGREPPADILPSLSLLPHTVRVAPATAEHVVTGPVPDAVLVDARRDLVQAKRVLLALRVAATSVPVIAVVTDGGWAAVSADWGADDLLLHTAGPGEVEARLRLAIGRRTQSTAQLPDEIRSGGLVVNEATYSARINGRSLDLTFKEFELLKFLAQHPGRVFTRAQLLQEVWGYDYFGGTRTVDVHVRRLRAKLGAENEALIGTVRNVGYRFVPGRSGGVRADDQTVDLGSDDEAAETPDDRAREALAEGRRDGSRSDLTASFRAGDASRETAGLGDRRESGHDATDLRAAPVGSLPSVAHADF